MRPAHISPVAAETGRTVALVVVLVAAAAVWVAFGHSLFGIVDADRSPFELASDLVPVFVLAAVGLVVSVRWSLEHDRTMAALRASEAWARDLVETAADGILVSDPDGRHVDANPAMCRMLGYTRDELLGMRAGDLAAEDDAIRPSGEAAARELLVGESGDDSGVLVERRYRRRDGTAVPVEVRYSILPDGRRQRIVRDVSERLRAEADETREARIRLALMDAVQRVPHDASLEEAGDAICSVLATLPDVDFIGLEAFVGEDVVMIAGRVPESFPTQPGESLPPARARYIRMRAAEGPWAEYWAGRPEYSEWGASVSAAGLRAVAFGPLFHGGECCGVLVIGTADDAFARTLVEHAPGLAAFTATVSGLVGERLLARRTEVRLRSELRQLLDTRAMHPVFQPIVDLETGDVVAYEALTRFDSGQRPDLVFEGAWSVGLGSELELATLDAALHEARELPAGKWLNVNVSPRLFGEPQVLADALVGADRPVVLEITEHESIADYARIRRSLQSLGSGIRIAVDDAGAGIANFSHIVELRPDFVKLDIGLVRRVNADLGRQALIVAMRHFARTSGCRLIAEGIEAGEEARTLAQLGVEFGQGYWLGRPARVDDLEAPSRVDAA